MRRDVARNVSTFRLKAEYNPAQRKRSGALGYKMINSALRPERAILIHFQRFFMLGFQPENRFFRLFTQRAAALALGWVIFGFQPKNITQHYTMLHNITQYYTI